MNGFENQSYLIGWIISNVAALLMLLAAWKRVRLARVLFFLLFAWACWINWKTALNSPEVYQDYASLSVLTVYKEFITGWFHQNSLLAVGFIATCQGLIAISMLLKGNVLRLGIIGGIIFLTAIVPLGVGAGFPATITMAMTLFIIWRKGADDYLWKKPLLVAPFTPTAD